MVEICVIVFPAKSICHSYTSAEARGVKASDVKLWPGICAKYFLSFPQKNLSPEKTETNFLNDKIDQNTNFAKLPSAKWLLLV